MGVQKTRCSKKFRIKNVGEVQNGAKVAPKSAIVTKRLRKWSQTAPKGARREPKGSQRKPKGAKRKPKGDKREPKGSNRDPKGSQKKTKGGPKGIQKSAQAPGSILGSKKGCRRRVFGIHFGLIFHEKVVQKSMQNWRSKKLIFFKKRSKKGANIDATNQEFTKCCFSEKRCFPLGKQHFLKVEGSQIS